MLYLTNGSSEDLFIIDFSLFSSIHRKLLFIIGEVEKNPNKGYYFFEKCISFRRFSQPRLIAQFFFCIELAGDRTEISIS